MNAHDSWASFYDFVYEKSFGDFYGRLTGINLETICKILPKGRVLDFGAGTGRLSVPLAEAGYAVTAIEASDGMVKELKRKAAEVEISIHHCRIDEFHHAKGDLAIAMFTVMSYLTTEEALASSARAIFLSLDEGGLLFFDLPDIFLFSSGAHSPMRSSDFQRTIRINPTAEADVYTYHEKCSGVFEGRNFEYEDRFPIRYWDPDRVDAVLREQGFIPVRRFMPGFKSTGSSYHLYKKATSGGNS